MDSREKLHTGSLRALAAVAVGSRWGMHRLWLALAALSVTLIVSLSCTARADVFDVEAIRAEPFHWLFDHASEKGVRGTDLKSFVGGVFAQRFPQGYWPYQIRRAYGFDRLLNTGAGQIIAIVNAFHYLEAASDLKTFIDTFRLRRMYGLPGRAPCTVAAGPHSCFQQIHARPTPSPLPPPGQEVWNLESALDIQWAHAIAPGADILLVEASSNALLDLFQAVQRATIEGASIVSISWGAPEFPAQSIFEPLFVPGVTFVAASGDSGNEANYPAASPRVIAVGGTTLPLNLLGVRTKPETAWTNSGGGISMFAPGPGYQSDYPIPNTGGQRGIPDVAYNADPRTPALRFTFQRPPLERRAGGWSAVLAPALPSGRVSLLWSTNCGRKIFPATTCSTVRCTTRQPGLPIGTITPILPQGRMVRAAPYVRLQWATIS